MGTNSRQALCRPHTHRVNPHTHTATDAHTQAPRRTQGCMQAHPHMRDCMHAHIQAARHARNNTHSSMLACVYVCACVRACSCTCACVHVHVCMRVHRCRSLCLSVCLFMCAVTCACRCTRTHSAPTHLVCGMSGTASQEELMLRDTCIVVDPNDNILGGASKADAHKFNPSQPHGLLHRAFSVKALIFSFRRSETALASAASRLQNHIPWGLDQHVL
jgi:hypothetical protein